MTTTSFATKYNMIKYKLICIFMSLLSIHQIQLTHTNTRMLTKTLVFLHQHLYALLIKRKNFFLNEQLSGTSFA